MTADQLIRRTVAALALVAARTRDPLNFWAVVLFEVNDARRAEMARQQQQRGE